MCQFQKSAMIGLSIIQKYATIYSTVLTVSLV